MKIVGRERQGHWFRRHFRQHERMIASKLKRPGYIREGFRYQDLVAIQSLLLFYRDRTLYRWIKVEADEGTFDGIDDVVVCRADGLLELTQVKFAADPARQASALCWDWLLQRTKRGKSKLHRWCATTLAHLDQGSLAASQLRTDRIPDVEFARALRKSKIEYDRLSPERRQAIEQDLGGEAQARRFFATFEFKHSEPHIDDLEATLRDSVLHETDDGGWALFCAQVARWATRKGEPGGDGRIRYIHLQQAFSPARPKPLPQNFDVPPAYQVPDTSFDTAFQSSITGADGITVLWGPPGRGKSTYLSHCVERVDHEQILCIRHHYFLGLDERPEGRFHIQAIARSFEHQLGEYMPPEARRNMSVGQMVEGAAQRLAREGRRLVVVVDGLDHVWRENHDPDHMNELFAGLLPVPDNVHLVVGTQKVAPDNLPARLIDALHFDHWTELPAMSSEAVRHWTKVQDEAGRLRLVDSPDREAERIKVADALHSISSGLPLHLIYSFEALVGPGDMVDAAAVRALPACPTGDIRDYYRQFLDRASSTATQILHLLAGLRFGPPRTAFAHFVGDARHADIISEIAHLLEFREADVRPFHGSLFAFMRELDDHPQIFRNRLAAVVAWLEGVAPAYWRDAWLWVTQAQADNERNLLDRTDWYWAVDFLAKGYPIEQLVEILGHGEQVAFEALDLASLLRLRAIKIRALNGPEFQTQDWHLFAEVATMLTDDPVPLALHRTVLSEAPTALLPYLVEASSPETRRRFAERVVEEIRERFARGPREDMHDPNHSQELANAFARTVLHLDSDWLDRLVRFADDNEITDVTLTEYARAAIRQGQAGKVLDVAERVDGRQFDRELFAAFALEGLGPGKRPKARGVAHPPTQVLAILKGERPTGPHRRRDLAKLIDRGPEAGDAWSTPLGPILHAAYFDCLAARLAGESGSPWSRYKANPKTEHVAQGLAAFEALATVVATTWKGLGTWPSFGELIESFDLEAPDRHSHETERQFVGVRLALAEIAVDHILLGRAIDGGFSVEAEDMRKVHGKSFWSDALWIHLTTERRLPLHSKEAARTIALREAARLKATRAETNESTDDAVKLALFATDNGLQVIGSDQLHRALGYLLGYGWRKDPFAYEVLNTIELMVAAGDEDAKRWLLEVSPAIDAILEFTDGRGTRGARSALHALLLDVDPGRAAGCLKALIEDDDWHYANELIEEIAKHDIADGAVGSELLRTFISPAERRALLRATSKRPERVEVLWQVLRTTGLTLREERARDAKETKEDRGTPMRLDRRRPPDQHKYPPGRLAEFIEDLLKRNFYSASRKYVTEWLEHWAGEGQASAALDDLWEVSGGTRFDLLVDNALDVAARVALECRGRSAAFEWLVRAQITRNSWSSYYTSEKEALARFDFVATHFKNRWEEFLRRTSRSALAFRREGGGLSVGYERLVQYLLKVGEIERAKACTRSIMDIFLAETSTMHFDTPSWAK